MGLLRRSTVPLLLVALACTVIGTSESATPTSDLMTVVEAAGVPGGAVAVLAHDRVTDVTTFGDVSADRRFLWGSVSKPLAAAVAHDLADRRALDLDASAATIVGGAPDVPVRSLLDHTSGLGFGADVLDVDRPAGTALQVAAEHPAPPVSPGSHRYSSLGYLYLQAVIEARAGSYEEAVRRAFPHTTVGASAASCRHLAPPHRLTGPWAWPLPTGYDGAGAAYGYTCGTIGDLAAVARRHLEQPQVGTPVPTKTPHQSYGDGWRITAEPDGRTTHWHTGTVPGYFSAVYLDPDSQAGVVVLLDASGFLHEERLAAVTRAAYDHATGRTPSPLPSTLPADAAPVGLGVAALMVGAFAVSHRRRSRRALVVWVIALTVTSAGLVGALMVWGYPARYVWLWEPGLAVGSLLLVTAMALGTSLAAPTSRPTPTGLRRSSART